MLKKKEKDLFKIVILVFSVPIALLVFVTVLASMFADGGTILDRIFLGIINPIATILVFLSLLLKIEKEKQTKINYFIGISVSIAVFISVTIVLGMQKGDWELPLVLVVPQIMYLIYYIVKK